MKLKTKLHWFDFNLKYEGGKQHYAEMVEKIKANSRGRGHKMHAIGGNKDFRGEPGTTEEVEIETDCIFDNQWNETTRRLFDWYEEAIFVNGREQKHIKRGHWLEITPDMSDARRLTLKCGYCGKHYGPFHDVAPDDGFCRACLDSPYLKEEEIYLTRLQNLTEPHPERLPLTDEEKAKIIPEYVSRQTTGNESRNKKKLEQQRADIEAEYKEQTANAADKRNGLLWILEKGFTLDNVIYYSHTKRFCFGWRNGGLSDSVVSKLLDIISEFPYLYTICKADGTKLEN